MLEDSGSLIVDLSFLMDDIEIYLGSIELEALLRNLGVEYSGFVLNK